MFSDNLLKSLLQLILSRHVLTVSEIIPLLLYVVAYFPIISQQQYSQQHLEVSDATVSPLGWVHEQALNKRESRLFFPPRKKKTTGRKSQRQCDDLLGHLRSWE